MAKTSLLDCVIEGSAAVGRPSLAAKIRALREKRAGSPLP